MCKSREITCNHYWRENWRHGDFSMKLIRLCGFTYKIYRCRLKTPFFFYATSRNSFRHSDVIHRLSHDHHDYLNERESIAVCNTTGNFLSLCTAGFPVSLQKNSPIKDSIFEIFSFSIIASYKAYLTCNGHSVKI